MRKMIFSFVVVAIAIMAGCQMPTGGDPVGSEPVYELSGPTFTYQIDGGAVNQVASYDYVEVSRSIAPSEEVVAVSEIPGVGTVVETDTGNYYLENGSDFDLITLPADTSDLHIYQFAKFNEDIYFGVDNQLYRVSTTDADFTDADFTDATLVVDGNIFNSAPDTLQTNLHYIVNETDETVLYWPGDLDDTERTKEYNNKGTAKTDDDDATEEQHVHDKLHIGYMSMGASGEIRNLWGETVTFDNIGSRTQKFTYDGYTRSGWSQSFDLNGVLVNNRIDTADADMNWTFPIYVARDTMIREYRDRIAYTVADTTRHYLGLDYSGSTLTVDVMEYVHGSAMASLGTFDVEMEDGTLIPNMFTANNGDVYLVIDDTLYLYDESDGYTSSVVFDYGFRLDAVTVLPDQSVIVMDGNGDWYNSDGSTYTGDNVVAQY